MNTKIIAMVICGILGAAFVAGESAFAQRGRTSPTPTASRSPVPPMPSPSSPAPGPPPRPLPPERAYPLTNPIGGRNLLQVIADFGNALILVAAPLVAILVTIGALQMLTAAGNSEKFAKGKQTLMYAVIGFGIVLLAQGITAIIRQIFQ